MSESENPRERRLVLRLLGYWRDLCGARDWPTASDVVSADMDDMWDYSFILDFKGSEPVFRHFGNWHTEFYGADMSGQAVSALTRDTLAERSTYYFAEVLRRRIPSPMVARSRNRADARFSIAPFSCRCPTTASI